jgi:hypothetical protein
MTSPEIERARVLLQTVRHASMATVNADGSPHNTPFLFLHDEKLSKIYWGSHPASQHSGNIIRTGQIFVTIYDAFERGGLYIRANQGRILEGRGLDEALRVHNMFRAQEKKAAIDRSYYEAASSQRMWSATVDGLWVNSSERDEQGLLIKDFRQEIRATDLFESGRR